MITAPRFPRQDAVEVWQDVLSRTFQVFSYYHWYWLEIEHPKLKGEERSITVKNAALESSLMSIRDLDDFFRSSGGRKDDVLSSDFQYTPQGKILSDDEREGINKKLAHLTYCGVHERRLAGIRSNPRTWDYADLAVRAMYHFAAFLDFLESVFFASDTAQQKLIRSARKVINPTVANIKALAKHELDFTA